MVNVEYVWGVCRPLSGRTYATRQTMSSGVNARKWLVTLFVSCIFLFLAGSATALTITAPNATTYVSQVPANVTLSWSGNASTYAVLLANDSQALLDVNLSTNQTVVLLEQGTYMLNISTNSTYNSTSFTIVAAMENTTNTTNETTFENETNSTPQPSIPSISITVENSMYETGDTVRLQATTNQSITASLRIERNSQTIETYTLSISSTVDLIYIPEQAGAYTVILQADGATATTTFTVTQTQALVADYTFTAPVVNKRTTFTASASGGTPPYSYQWVFSDDTTSSGATSEHYFFETGPHDASLIVTDSKGAQQVITKQFTVAQETYQLDILLRNQNAQPLEGFTITITDEENDDTSKQTPASGIVVFTDLRGNYTIDVTRTSTHYYNTTVNISQNLNAIITLNLSTTQSTTNTTNITTTNTTNTTSASTSSSGSGGGSGTASTETQTAEQKAEETQKTIVEQQQLAAAQTAQQILSTAKTTALEELRQTRFDLRLSAKKDNVLTKLGLYAEFDAATTAITDASTEQEIAIAIKNVPTAVSIDKEAAAISYPDKESLEQYTKRYTDALNVVDEDLQESYLYSIKRILENVSIKTTTTQVTITYPERKEQHTIVEREVTSPQNTYVVEVIPKTFAPTAAQLKITGDYQVIESDPIIRFNDPFYTYSTQRHSSEIGEVLVVPIDLQEPGMLTGLLSIRFGDAGPGRTMIYAIVLLGVIAGLVAGPKLLAKKPDEDFETFAQLAGQALDMINNGNKEHAAQITPDIVMIYETLSQDKKQKLQPIIEALQENAAEQEFLSTVSHTYEQMQHAKGDVNNISRLYENVLQSFEGLSPTLQQNLQPHITQLDEHLELLMQA